MYKKILLIILIICIFLGIGYFIYTNVSFVNDDLLENTPLTSNTEEPVNKDTISSINIYLINKMSKDLEKETRSISIKELSTNPYISLLNELKKKTDKDALLNPIPENTQILSANLNINTLVIDMSNEFLTQDISNELDLLILKSIAKTMTNLKEVKNIKINIDGNANAKFGTFDLSSTFSNTSF